jgi:hypothetical protein
MGKEILIALRKKIPVSEYLYRINGKSNGNGYGSSYAEEKIERPAFSGDVKEAVKSVYEKIRGSRGAVLLDSNMDIIRRVSAREVSKMIRMARQNVFAVVVDGSAVGSIIEACEERNVQHLAATQFSGASSSVNLISL